MKTNIVFFLLLCFGQSCVPTLPDEELTMTRTPYNGTDIRLDGCFVSDHDELHKYCEYDFFYSNGTLFSFSDRLNIDNLTQITGGIEPYRKNKVFWGIFTIENKTIKSQKWRISEDETHLKVVTRYYKIINDTTLSIDLNTDGNIRHYHFKRFMPKPDSTNMFIK